MLLKLLQWDANVNSILIFHIGQNCIRTIHSYGFGVLELLVLDPAYSYNGVSELNCQITFLQGLRPVHLRRERVGILTTFHAFLQPRPSQDIPLPTPQYLDQQ